MTTAQNILTIAKKYIGTNEADGSHKKIIDAYNAHKPLAVGYAVKYNDDWCDTFVSKVAIEAGALDLIGTECGVERHIEIFKKLGIWDDNGSKTPKPGDIITYNWGDTTQSNDGFADHIGFVESVSGNTITTIEGNYSNSVKRRTLTVGTGTIRGYARPKYSTSTTTPATKSIDTLVSETKAGKHGNGDERKKSLGSNYDAVMKVINGGSTVTPTPVSKPITTSIVLVIDGVLGAKTITRMQQHFGTPVDGIISEPDSSVVRALQKWLGVTVDGDWGPITTRALQERLGTTVDGIISEPSSEVIKELQRRLNAGKL